VKTVSRLFLVAALVLAAGCATVPPESIELSATIGRDLSTVHEANRNLALMHFDHLLADVDRFVDEVYRPYIIQATMEDLDLVNELQLALAGEHDLDALDILTIYAEEITAQIDTFRKEMRAPLLDQQREVLLSLDAAFEQLQTANAVVTGHLKSIADVHDAQAEMLRHVGLEDYRVTIAAGLAGLSNEVAELLDRARAAEADLDALPDEIEAITDRLP
jgi:hypothetical protein